METFLRSATKLPLAVALLVILPLILYWKSFFYDFSPLDDQWLIVQQSHMLKSWSYLFGAFYDTIQKMYYRPLLMITFSIDHHLGGLNPTVYHITNVLIHLTAVVLLYHFLLRLKTEKRTAFLLCLVFAVHPVLLHAVAWIPGRNDSLLCVFVLASFINLKTFAENSSKRYFALHILFFLCALFTKETSVLLPVAYFYLMVISGYRDKRLFYLAGFWVLAICMWLWARYGITQHFPFSVPTTFLTIRKFIHALAGNFGKIIFPVVQGLSAIPRTLSVTGGVATAVIVIIVLIKTPKANRQTGFFGLLLCFSLLVLPVWFGVLAPHGEQYEHRLYVPAAALFIVIGQARFKQKHIFHGILVVIICLFAYLTYRRMDLYKNSENFLIAAVRECPENYFLQAQMGTYWSNSGNCEAAIPHYSEAIKLNPVNPQLYLNRAQCYREMRMFKEARQDSNLAQQGIGRRYMEARGAKTSTVQDFAKVMADELKNINTQIENHPSDGNLYVQRAKMYFDRRMGKEALADLKKACELEPENEHFRKYYEELNRSFPHD